MHCQHLIDSAEFDIRYGEKTVAPGERSQIDRFLQTELIEIVDEVFKQAADAGRVYRIDRLEIDLGEIPYADYRNIMRQRLRRQLAGALDDIRYTQQVSPAMDKRVVDKQSAALEELFYFLQQGFLPWYSRVGEADALERLFIQSLRETPEKIIEFINANVQRPVILERMQRQFPAQSIQQLVSLLSLSHSVAAQHSEAELERMIAHNSSAQTTACEVESSTTELDELYAQLIAALRAGEFDQLRAVWSRLYRCDSAGLQKTLRDYGQSANLRKRIASDFTQPMREELVMLLEPVQHVFILAVVAQPEWYQPKAQGGDVQRQTQREALWEFTLAYLLVERGSRFNKKTYLGSLVRQMAAAHNQEQSALLASLRANVERLSGNNRLGADIISILAELEKDEASPAVAASMVDSYAQYERLLNRLFNSACGREDADWSESIRALLRHAPWLIMRLYRELQSRAKHWAVAAGSLSAELLRELTQALLAVTTRSEMGQSSDLALAVAAYADRAADQKTFYCYVLDCLIKKELIDLEAIAQAPKCTRPAGGPQAAAEPKVQPTAKRIPTAQAQQIISDSLSGTHSLSFSEQQAFIESVEYLAVRQPGLLQRQLETALQQESCIAHLLEYLPERVHVKLLSLLGLFDSGPILQQAEVLNNACYAAPAAISPERLKAHKWRFIYAYLAYTGYLYNERNFTRQYVASLMAQAGPIEKDQFHSLLAERLLQDSLPSTLHLTRRVIESLRAADSGDQSATVPEAAETDDQTGNEPVVSETIYISNAGLVLLAPYLPRLFELLGVCEKSAFKNRAAAERAVHMLQFLVNEQSASQEYQLVLNKLLCGVKPGKPIRRGIDLSEHEKQQLEGLLQAVTQHWKALANTSINGLRESFLQRGGRLQLKNDAWHLSVEEKPYDMLLDQIPWSYTTIKFSWMQRVIYVEWRT